MLLVHMHGSEQTRKHDGADYKKENNTSETRKEPMLLSIEETKHTFEEGEQKKENTTGFKR
jgi:hypothetical protein